MITEQNLQATVRRGNLRRDLLWLQQGQAFIPTYVANGSIGGLVDEFGLHSRCNYGMNNGRTHLAHVAHYSQRRLNGGHLLRSLFNMQATGFRGEAPGLGLVDDWEQELDLWTAACSTRWSERGSNFSTRVFASWALPHLWVWELNQSLADPADRLSLALEFDVRKAENHGRIEDPDLRFDDLTIDIATAGPSLWKVVSKTDCCRSELLFRITGGEVWAEGSRLHIKAGEKLCLSLLFLDKTLDSEIAGDPGSFLARKDHWEGHVASAASHWQSAGLLHLPDGTPEASWWPLYAYYLPAVLPSQPSHILVADGLTANNWGYGFPQDQWYVMLPLARLGLKALNEAQLPCYNDNLEAYRRYAQRIARREGLFYPWAAPFENLDGFETNGPTNKDTYQFHNSAYVVAMVWESYRIHRDADFLARHFELLQGVAEFYTNNIDLPNSGMGKAVFRNPDVPLRSQDEATAEGAPTVQPVCSVWASLYCFSAFLEASGVLGQADPDVKARVKNILDVGFDLEPLIREDGTLRTSATDTREHGMQKHPIQLSPLTFLPMATWMDWEPVHNSWNVRHLLCEKTRVPISSGWTFAQLVFSSARMRNGVAVQRDLELVPRARYADPMWIQFYECSHRYGWTERIAFYFVTMQVYTKTILECLVQDCREAIEFFPALLPRWKGKDLAFRKLHLRDGLIVSGEVAATGSVRIEIEATMAVESLCSIALKGTFECCGDGGKQTFEGGKPFLLKLNSGDSVVLSGFACNQVDTFGSPANLRN